MYYIEDRIPDPESPVECVWELRAESAVEPQRISTDARAEIIVQLGDRFEQWTGAAWRPQPLSVFSGQITRPLLLRGAGAAHTVAFRLKPWATALACGADASSTTDQLLDLGALGGSFAQRCRALARLPRAERRRAALELFGSRVPRLNLPEPRVRHAVHRAEAASGDERVTQLARASHMSLRSFERHVAAAVGVSPKMLLRMLRFRAAAALLDRQSPAEVAARLGYADQSHLHKDFVRFAGVAPAGFASPESAMAEHFYRGR